MSRERGREPSAGRSNFGWSSLCRRIRRTGKGSLGKRSGEEDRWTWFGDEAPRKRSRVRRFVLIGEIAAGIAVVLAGALFVVLRTGDAGGPDAVLPTASSRATVAPSPSGAPTMAPTLTPASTTPAAGSPTPIVPSTAFQLSVWDAENRVWETDDLAVRRPTAGDGRTVPFLLYVEHAVAGQTYNVELTYECRSGQTLGLEFLTDFDRDAGDLPADTPPGPQRPFPDAAVVLPDDPSTEGDDQQQTRSIRIWGGTPQGVPNGPVPSSDCIGEKTVFVDVRALSETLHVLWGAQLGPATTIGGPAGETPFAMQVTVDGIGPSPAELNIIVPN